MDSASTYQLTAEMLKPRFPIWAVSKLKGQSKRDGGIIVRSCKASANSGLS